MRRSSRPLLRTALLLLCGLPFGAASALAGDITGPRVALVRAGIVIDLSGGWEVSTGPVTRPGQNRLLTLGHRAADWEDFQFLCSVRMKDAPMPHPELAKVAAALKKILEVTFQEVRILAQAPRRIAGRRGYALRASLVMNGRASRAFHGWYALGRRVVQFSLLAPEDDAKAGLEKFTALLDAMRPLKMPRGLDATDVALRRAAEATVRLKKQATAQKLAALVGPPAYFLIRQGELVLGAAGYEISAQHDGKGFRETTHLWFRDLKGTGFAQTLSKTATAGGAEEVFRYSRKVLADGKPTGDQVTIDAVVRNGRLSAERVRGAAVDHLQHELPNTYIPQTLAGLFQRWFARHGRGQILFTEFDFANFRLQDVLLAGTGPEAIVLDGRPRPAIRTVLLKMIDGQAVTTFHDPATGAPLHRTLGPLKLDAATLSEVRKHFPAFAP